MSATPTGSTPPHRRPRRRFFAAGFALLLLASCQSDGSEKHADFDRWEDALLSKDSPKHREITGEVVGCTGDHRVFVVLHNKSTYTHEGYVARLAFEPVAVRAGRLAFAFEVPAGEYCIVAYEDMNKDGFRNRAWDRAERVGHYRDHWLPWPPRFDEVRFKLFKDLGGIEIPLR